MVMVAVSSQKEVTASSYVVPKQSATWMESLRAGQVIVEMLSLLGRFIWAVTDLFFVRQRFKSHRILGMAFLIQFIPAVYLYIFDYERYLNSPFVWSLPLNGLLQSINAALTFTFLPKRADSGFAAVADKSVLSYYTVVENSFYAMQLVFASCYLHHDIRALIFRNDRFPFMRLVEFLFVFFIFYIRDFWPSSRIGAALENEKNKTDKNRRILVLSTYAIKGFYLLGKHFMGFFLNYLIFLDRVPANSERQRLIYGVHVLSAYSCTVSIFIHTLKFKGYIGPITAMIAYDIIIPGFAYIFWNMRLTVLGNLDLVAVCFLGLVLNLCPRPTWHVYQACVFIAFMCGAVPSGYA
eukprot:TRINITY_DN6527_c0_g1_i3.p1 TRINITY_DN6527_c0_g1~~TRINITY_DN6527_c0_g1_i3.p1  ORF type:complete len:352 (-),score=32.08 TRINITY_DN6527_c0_g1_i3:480-1535(-)